MSYPDEPQLDRLAAYTESLGDLLRELLNAADGDLNQPQLQTQLAASLAYSTMIQRGADPSIRFTLATRVAAALRPVCEDIASSKRTLAAKAMEKRFCRTRSPTNEAQWKRNTGMLKARGIIIFDFVLKNGFKDAAIEQEKMEQMMNEYV